MLLKFNYKNKSNIDDPEILVDAGLSEPSCVTEDKLIVEKEMIIWTYHEN